jgi:hypothetical protein
MDVTPNWKQTESSLLGSATEHLILLPQSRLLNVNYSWVDKRPTLAK